MARALIIEKGFEGLRMRDFADRVGIIIAALHSHVPSKQALIELVAQTRQMLDQARRAPNVDDVINPHKASSSKDISK
jgi:AcrR family transcriptional regulator